MCGAGKSLLCFFFLALLFSTAPYRRVMQPALHGKGDGGEATATKDDGFLQGNRGCASGLTTRNCTDLACPDPDCNPLASTRCNPSLAPRVSLDGERRGLVGLSAPFPPVAIHSIVNGPAVIASR